MGNEQGSNWKRGDPIGYIRQEIPEFSVPAYQRNHDRQNNTRWRETERFVSQERIYW